MMRRKWIIVDLDGTVADCTKRLHYVTHGARDWDSFFAEIIQDGVYRHVTDIIEVLSPYYNICCCTGRPEKYRMATMEHLRRNNCHWYSCLKMRPDNDTRPDFVVKAEMLDQMVVDGWEIAGVFDDRQSVVDMWRSKGLTCFQVRDPKEDGFTEDDVDCVLTIMVGPAGSGKSTWLAGEWGLMAFGGWACNWAIHPSHVVSSDQFRADLAGDFRAQDKNPQVFAALHAVVRTRLKHGLSTVIDATNIRDRDRKALRELAPSGCKIRYVVINRPMEKKQETAGWRDEVPGLIEKHDNTFNQNLKAILRGDGDDRVRVVDLREPDSLIFKESEVLEGAVAGFKTALSGDGW